MLRFLPRETTAPSQKALAMLHPYTGALARLLYARGVTDKEQAERFLHPSAEQMHDPFQLHGMEKAVALLVEARERQTPAVIYGDYDVDGMCAAAILADAFHCFGLEATPHIPLREEGYGLNLSAVERLARDYRLLVTVDLGITNHAEVRRAQELGMTVIVTDHHQLALEESPADVVISPLLGAYPFSRLCGAGVAIKLAQALLGWEAAGEYLDLAALATVADIVPLVGENRAMVALGLPKISAREREGIRALMEVSGADGQADSFTLGFQLAPRLNAAGRLKDANQGVRLLMTKDAAEADQIARELNTLNTRRKAMESEALAEAEKQAEGHDFTEERALIVRGKGWHVGVIGLVAGRLCRRYACPTAALSEEDGVLHGSLRSVPGVNIHACLQACDELLLRYGGHEQAAGVTLLAENYEAFCERLQQAVHGAAGEEAFTPSCEYDLPLSLGEVTEAMVEDIQRLAPFGCANPPPLFLARGVRLARRRACGADGSHLQLTLCENGHMLDGIAFGMGGMAARLPDEVDAVISLKKDTFRGVTAVKCEAEAIRPAANAGGKTIARIEDSDFAFSLLSALKELRASAEKAGKEAGDSEILLVEDPEALPPPDRGVLYVASARQSARAIIEQWPDQGIELCLHATTGPLCFPTLLISPRLSAVTGPWRRIVLLDGEIGPDWGKLWKARFPKAQIIAFPRSAALKALAADLDAGDEAYRSLYKLLRRNAFASLAQAAMAAGLSAAQAHVGLSAFAELNLIDYQAAPFAYALLPPISCNLGDGPTLAALRALAE